MIIILALGDIFYFLFLAPIIMTMLWIIVGIMQKFCCKCRISKFIIKYLNLQVKGYFWNGLIQFIYSGYIIISMCVLIGLHNLSFDLD